MIEFMKAKYRIDAYPFNNPAWFDDKNEAVRFGIQQYMKGKLVFLLEFRGDDDYTVTDIRKVRIDDGE